MIDIETHQIIDMIPSREEDDVTKWLKSYSNLEVISSARGIGLIKEALNSFKKTSKKTN